MPNDMLGKNAGLSRMFEGPLLDLAVKMNGQDGPRWEAAFKRFLRCEEPWPFRNIWRTITIGNYKDGYDLRDAIRKSYECDRAKGMIERIVPNKTKRILNLVLVSGEDLGFEDGVFAQDMYNRGHVFGLSPCPTEVGPELRLQYPDQPQDESLVLVMDGAPGNEGRCIFEINGPREVGSEGNTYTEGANITWVYDGWVRKKDKWVMVREF
jgi:hypothetical protein